MIRRALALLIASAPLAVLAAEASFDCRRASTAVETAICSSDELSAADAELGRVFRQALAERPDVRADQVRWIRERNARCGADPACLLAMIRSRTVELQSAMANRGAGARESSQESLAHAPQLSGDDTASSHASLTSRDTKIVRSPLAGVFVIPGLSKCDAPGPNGYSYSVVSDTGQLSSEDWVKTSWGWLPPTVSAGTRFIARESVAAGGTIFEEVRPDGSRCLAQLVVRDEQVLFGPEVAGGDFPSCGASLQGTLVGKPFMVRCTGVPEPLAEMRRVRAEEGSRIERALTQATTSEDLYQWARNSFLTAIQSSCRFTPPVSDQEWLDMSLSSRVNQQVLEKLFPMTERVYVAKAGERALRGCPPVADVSFGRVRLQVAPEAFLYQMRLRGWVDEQAVRISKSGM